MTFAPSNVRAVVFDIGGVFTYPSYVPVAQRLREIGYPCPTDLAEYRKAHHAGVRALVPDPGAPGRRVDDGDADSLLVYDVAYSQSIGVVAEDVAELRTALRIGWDWVHEQNVAAFHHMVAGGLPTAIVSNNNGTAPQQMRDSGICQVGPGPLPSVAAIVDSTLVGVAKPDPRIFAPAITALDVEPGAVLYVGDTLHLDVSGALAAGMQAIQLDPFDHHREFSHGRLPDLPSLVTSLGL